MVIARTSILIVLAGCLGKPAAPGAGPGVDADDDAPSGLCPPGTMQLPGDLVLRPQTAVADLDRDGHDDLFVWGRESNGTGRASVFVALGREPLALGCHDLALPLGDVEPLDVWVGDATGDGNPDLLVVSRAADTYPIHLYRGLAGGGVDPIPDIQAPLASAYGGAVGGTLANPEPVFVVAYAGNGATEVIFGGLNEPYAGLRIAATLQHDVLVRDNGAPPGALDLGQLEELGVQGPGDPQRLLAVGVSDAYALDHVARDAGSTRFARSSPTPLHGPGPQAVRFLKQPIGNKVIAVTEANNGDFDLIRIDHAGPPDVLLFDAQIDRMDVRDLALAHVDDDAEPDLMILAETVTAELTIFLDLVFTDPATAKVPIKAAMPAGRNLLAVGNFDGNPATPEQIFVLATTGAIIGCYHVVAGAPQACIVTCDLSACP